MVCHKSPVKYSNDNEGIKVISNRLLIEMMTRMFHYCLPGALRCACGSREFCAYVKRISRVSGVFWLERMPTSSY